MEERKGQESGKYVKFERILINQVVSAGIELIFFLVAGAVLCFGFGVRIMLITH